MKLRDAEEKQCQLHVNSARLSTYAFVRIKFRPTREAVQAYPASCTSRPICTRVCPSRSILQFPLLSLCVEWRNTNKYYKNQNQRLYDANRRKKKRGGRRDESNKRKAFTLTSLPIVAQLESNMNFKANGD